jgi:uncharacterized membrane protein
MDAKDSLIRNALLSLVALGFTALSSQAQAADNPNAEKCAGVIKAGKNDCGTSHSSCHGSISMDGDKEAWVEVPKGLCEKIAGAYVTTSPYAKPGGKDGAKN